MLMQKLRLAGLLALSILATDVNILVEILEELLSPSILTLILAENHFVVFLIGPNLIEPEQFVVSVEHFLHIVEFQQICVNILVLSVLAHNEVYGNAEEQQYAYEDE